ncbi:MAG TPA: hypothetical protein VG225_10305 [Terracidiphilus sp.]|nr:hypothetical protein [Terracidiphilus sp.]
MTAGWAELAGMAAMAAAGCACGCLILLRRFQRQALERQREMERQLSALGDVVRAVEASLLELHVAAEDAAEIAQEGAGLEWQGAGKKPVQEMETGMAPELQAAIAAAAVGFLGRNVQLRSARALPPGEASRWSQQGRMIVQSSHNPRSRR